MARYNGSCHCGAVNFEVDADLSKGVVCDCTICKRKGAVMVLIDKEALTITSGEESLSSYQFNTNIANHFFCKTCGIYTHHKRRRDDGFGVNTGCLDKFSVDDLEEVVSFKGSELSVVDSRYSLRSNRPAKGGGEMSI